MSDFDSVDFFTDASLIPDPYPYFDHLRRRCPVVPQSEQRVVAITGHKEALAVYKDPAFSSCVSVAGPFSGLPFEPAGDDIGDLIERHRSRIPMSDQTQIVTQVTEPIDVSRFGDEPNVPEIDAHVRSVMQTALDRLARKRRVPVLG